MPVVIRGGREAVRLPIVEDELPLAEVMAAGLEASGYHVWHTDNVSHAIALADEHRFDCVVLDVELGQQSGCEVADHLVAIKLPFFFATGAGDGAIPARLAAYSVLAKPFTLAKLVLFIERTATPQ